MNNAEYIQTESQRFFFQKYDLQRNLLEEFLLPCCHLQVRPCSLPGFCGRKIVRTSEQTLRRAHSQTDMPEKKTITDI